MSCLRISLAILALCNPLVGLAGSGIYAFVDAGEGIHLSNIPGDERYRVLVAPLVAANEKPQARSTHPGNRQAYSAVIAQIADRVGIDAALLHAVIAVESGYDAHAVSRRGAGGLMQLMPETAKRYGVADVFDPGDNVRGGALYLAELLKRFENDLRLALAAYNAGEAAVLKFGKRIPPYRETAAYVPKVVATYRRFQWSM
jgi:soluble lytic murein transglycosylase-like protein